MVDKFELVILEKIALLDFEYAAMLNWGDTKAVREIEGKLDMLNDIKKEFASCLTTRPF